MRAVWLIVAAVFVSSFDRQAHSQLPVAAGRQITMSNPAWKIFIPSTFHQRPGYVADLLVHFHGDPQTVWNNALYAKLNSVIVTVNYSGLSSAYSTPFSNSSLFQSLLSEALTIVRQQTDIPDNLQWDSLGVSSFSAGYGAVREILKSATYRNQVDGLLAADSLYAATAADGTPLDSQMVDYKTFANLAKNGSKTFIFSHSQVPTYTYESTLETGNELLQYLGVSPSSINSSGLGTLDFYRYAETGNFRLWGATGADGDAHLEHLRYIGEFLEDLPLAKIPPQGDFNGDSRVDAADYVIWRSTKGFISDLRANGDKTARSAWIIDNADYVAWRTGFESFALSGTVHETLPVPEPSVWVAMLIGVAAAMQVQCRHGQRGQELRFTATN